MKTALHHDDHIPFTSINKPMLLCNTTRPPPLQIALERLRFSYPRKRTSQRISNKFVHTSEHFPVILLPPKVVCPASRQPHQSHSSPDLSFPAPKSANPCRMRSAFAGVESKCSVSSIAAYSSAARITTVPAPFRVIVIGSRFRVAASINPANPFLASVYEIVCMTGRYLRTEFCQRPKYSSKKVRGKRTPTV